MSGKDFQFKSFVFTLKYLDRLAKANSIDPDQLQQNTGSDQGLYYLPLF